MRRFHFLRLIAWMLPAIGAINWGLTGAANFNIVHALFGRNPSLERFIYILVGVTGLLSLYQLFTAYQTPYRARRPFFGLFR